MQVSLNFDSLNALELVKAKRIIAILEDQAGSQELPTQHEQARPSPAAAEMDVQKLTKLVRTTTGGPLWMAAQRFQAGEQFTLRELGNHLGWSGSKSVSWFAKFSRTCRSWNIRPLQRHEGYPKRYSMTEEVRVAILRAFGQHNGEAHGA